MIQIEKENFRVDSTGWRQLVNEQDITYLESPTKDIWEYVSGVKKNLIGQQLFTWDAAMRETRKAGKQMPTNEEWATLIQDPGENGEGKLKKEAEQFDLKGLLAGCRSNTGSFNNLGSYGYDWSSSEYSSSTSWYRGLYSGNSAISRYYHYKAYGFSVRCLKN